MRICRLIQIALIALVALSTTVVQAATTVENIRVWAENGKTRVVLDLSKPVNHNIFTLRGPDRLVVDLKDGRLPRNWRLACRLVRVLFVASAVA